MTINNILENKNFIIRALLSMIYEEQRRIINDKVATSDDIKNLLDPAVDLLTKKIGKDIDDKNILINILTNIHTKLSSLKFAEDFTKMADDGEFYKALPIPYKGEKFYDLSSLLKEVEKEKELEEEKEEPEETLEEKSKEETFATSINKLEKLAYNLGSLGKHDLAYKIERIILKLQDTGE